MLMNELMNISTCRPGALIFQSNSLLLNRMNGQGNKQYPKPHVPRVKWYFNYSFFKSSQV